MHRVRGSEEGPTERSRALHGVSTRLAGGAEPAGEDDLLTRSGQKCSSSAADNSLQPLSINKRQALATAYKVAIQTNTHNQPVQCRQTCALPPLPSGRARGTSLLSREGTRDAIRPSGSSARVRRRFSQALSHKPCLSGNNATCWRLPTDNKNGRICPLPAACCHFPLVLHQLVTLPSDLLALYHPTAAMHARCEILPLGQR